MKKVTAIVGTASRKHTYSAVQRFLASLEAHGDVECEIVALGDYRVGTCRGCKLCFEKGEEFCPLNDDRDALIGKIMASEGVVFASPNYSFQVSAIMKTFLDRLGFLFHRPRLHGKTFTSIVAQGIYGGRKIVKYLDFVGGGLGFNVVKGSCVTAFEPMTAREHLKRDKALAKQAERFHGQLSRPAYRVPTLLDLMLFRMSRTSIGVMLRNRDYTYFSEKGWLTSDYYYPTRLNPLKRAAGNLFDLMGTRMSMRRGEELSSDRGGAGPSAW